MMTEATIISADDHMDLNELPADLWQKRLPAKFRDAAPKVVVDPKRGPVWEGDGARWAIWPLQVACLACWWSVCARPARWLRSRKAMSA